jgi:hypothetical protein
VIRNSAEHILAIRLIDTKFNQQVDEARQRFLDNSKHADYDPDLDDAFQRVRKQIEAERSEEYRYLRMELAEAEGGTI